MTASLMQKAIAVFMLVFLDLLMFLFSPLLGIVAFFVLLPGVWAVWRL